MTPTLRPGITKDLEWRVTAEYSTVRGERQVFSTPSMVLLVERVCVALLEPFLTAGQSSVGTRVDVRHLAPTLVGMRVRAEAHLTAVDGRRLSFEIKVFDDLELIGEAYHERYLIDTVRYVARLDQKSGRVNAARVQASESRS